MRFRLKLRRIRASRATVELGRAAPITRTNGASSVRRSQGLMKPVVWGYAVLYAVVV